MSRKVMASLVGGVAVLILGVWAVTAIPGLATILGLSGQHATVPYNSTPIDAATLAGHPGLYYLDAGNLTGTLSTDRFSAYQDLQDEGRIGVGDTIITDQTLRDALQGIGVTGQTSVRTPPGPSMKAGDGLTLTTGADGSVTLQLDGSVCRTSAACGVGGVTGQGSPNHLAKFSGGQVLGDSLVYDDGSHVGIGTTNPTAALSVNGDTSISGNATVTSLLPSSWGNIKSTVTDTVVDVTDPNNPTWNTYNDSPKWIAVGRDNNLQLVYQDPAEVNVHYVHCLDVDCAQKTDVVVAHDDNKVDYESVAVGADGFARIQYITYDAPNQLHFIQCTSTDCSTKSDTIVATGSYYENVFTLGTDGFARIAFTDYNQADAIVFVQCTNAACTTHTAAVTVGGTYGWAGDIAFGLDGLPQIVYSGVNTDMGIKLITCTTADCSSHTISMVQAEYSYYLQAQRAPDGFLRISASANNDEFIQCTNADCSGSIVTQLDTGGRYIGMQLASEGNARIVTAQPEALTYYQCTNASCSTSNKAQYPNAGNYPIAIALGTDGLARIGHYDANSNGVVRTVIRYDRLVTKSGSNTAGISALGASSQPFDSLYVSQASVQDLSVSGNVTGSGDLSASGRLSGGSLAVATTGSFANGLSIGSSAIQAGKLFIQQSEDTNNGGIALWNQAGTGSLRWWIDPNGVQRMDNLLTAGGNISINGTGTGSLGIGVVNPVNRLDVNGALAVGTYAGATAAPANGLAVSGNITSPGTGAGSEKFGAGATAAGTNAVAIGPGATATNGNAIAIGWLATVNAVSGGHGIAIGDQSRVSADYAMSIGRTSSASNSYAVALGTFANASGYLSTAINNAQASGTHALAIGYSAASAYSDSIVFGYQASATAASQFVAKNISNVYFGGGVTSATPVSATINGTGGSGTDITGSDLVLAGGKGTGLGNGGALIFQTAAAAGLSGSSLNTLTERMRIDANGNVGLGVSSNINSKLTFAAATTAAGGILFGTDTNLYRSAANTLNTDSLFSTKGGLLIGTGGAQISRFLSATTTWTPPSLNTGSATTTTVAVTNAAVGDTVTVSFSQPLPDNVLISGSVSAAGTVKVVLFNASGSTVSLSAGTLRADVWQH